MSRVWLQIVERIARTLKIQKGADCWNDEAELYLKFLINQLEFHGNKTVFLFTNSPENDSSFPMIL